MTSHPKTPTTGRGLQKLYNTVKNELLQQDAAERSVFSGFVAPTVSLPSDTLRSSLCRVAGRRALRLRCPKNKNQMFERATAATETVVAHGDRPDPLKGPLPIGSDI